MTIEAPTQELLHQTHGERVPPEKSGKLIIQKLKNIFFKIFFGKPKQGLVDVPSETEEELNSEEIEINSLQDSLDVSLESEERLVSKDAKERRVPKETEINSLQVALFQKDIKYMIDAYLEVEDYRNEGLSFRALIQINPDDPLGLPILVARPIDRPGRAEDEYYNGSGSHMYHYDIWKDWVLLSETDPNNERTLIVETVNQKLGGYDRLQHVYLEVKRDKKGKPIIEFESGFRYFQTSIAKQLRPEQDDPQLTTEETTVLIKQLARYGIDTVRLSYGKEPISVEEVVLIDMMRPLILENAEKLRTVITDSAVTQYIRLAYKFLTKPDFNKSSPLYYRFLEFEELIKKIDESNKNK